MLSLAVKASALSAHGAAPSKAGRAAEGDSQRAREGMAGCKQHPRDGCDQRQGKIPFPREARRLDRLLRVAHASTSLSLAACAPAANSATLDTISARAAPG